MPIEISSTSDGTIALAHCYGTLAETDIRESARFAFGTHRIEQGQDRIVTIDRDAQLHAIDIEALKNFQRYIFEEETRDGRTAQFRSVLVYASPAQEKIMKLYQAIWSGLNLPNVEFFVVDSKDEALQILTGKRDSNSAD